MMQALFSSLQAGKMRVLARVTEDLTSHRAVWNYVYMMLYVIVAVYLTFWHAETCGGTVVMTTGGVVTAIFTNVVWSKTYEMKNKEHKNEKPTVDSGEVGAGD